MSRAAVMLKRGFTDRQYQRFATSVGHRINFNKKMKVLASYFGVSIFNLGEAVKNSLISESETVIDLILEFRNQPNEEDDYSIPGILSRELTSMPLKSFERFGDRNCLTSSILRHYIHEGGIPVDVQVDILNETYPVGIEIDDIINFILDNPEGPDSYKSPLAIRREEIKDAIIDQLGIRISDRLADQFHSEFFTTRTTEINQPF